MKPFQVTYYKDALEQSDRCDKPTNRMRRGGPMARRVEEIKRVRRDIVTDNNANTIEDTTREEVPAYEEEYYDMDSSLPEESSLNTASGVLAIALLALAIYLIWAALR